MGANDSQRSDWNARAAEWAAREHWTQAAMAPLTEPLVALARRGMRVLDVGTGSGQPALRRLAESRQHELAAVPRDAVGLQRRRRFDEPRAAGSDVGGRGHAGKSTARHPARPCCTPS